MNVMVPIPDDLAARFGSEAELGRRAVEALALEEYRAGRLTRPEMRHVLGFATHGELDGFLKAHGVHRGLSLAQIDGQVQVVERQDSIRLAAADDLVARFQTFAAGHTLEDLDITNPTHKYVAF